MFKKTLLAVAVLSASMVAMADVVSSVNTYYNLPTGCAIQVDGKQIGSYTLGPYSVVGTHAVSVRCGENTKATDYSVNYTDGMFSIAYSGGSPKYMLSAIVNGDCPMNSSATQGTITTPMKAGDNIEIYFDQNFGPSKHCAKIKR